MSLSALRRASAGFQDALLPAPPPPQQQEEQQPASASASASGGSSPPPSPSTSPARPATPAAPVRVFRGVLQLAYLQELLSSLEMLPQDPSEEPGTCSMLASALNRAARRITAAAAPAASSATSTSCSSPVLLSQDAGVTLEWGYGEVLTTDPAAADSLSLLEVDEHHLDRNQVLHAQRPAVGEPWSQVRSGHMLCARVRAARRSHPQAPRPCDPCAHLTLSYPAARPCPNPQVGLDTATASDAQHLLAQEDHTPQRAQAVAIALVSACPTVSKKACQAALRHGLSVVGLAAIIQAAANGLQMAQARGQLALKGMLKGMSEPSALQVACPATA